ncbi:hypothetical protein [Thiobacillus denitrificans]|uniref:hypothetical protein n=1 Tax=Thiobacillus denitrificans TaxID=36861 RepID=UPI000377EDC5|nr:hypothetical protein [Thiobacillus denitrificans]
MLMPHEAQGYSEWVVTNFLTVPVLMISGVLMVVTIGAVVNLLSNPQLLRNAAILVRLGLLTLLDGCMTWYGVQVVLQSSWVHVLTFGNALWVVTPTVLTGLIVVSLLHREQTPADNQ